MVRAQVRTRADVVEWRSAAPFWEIPGAGGRSRSPNILRFAQDDFMERFQALLADPDPEALAALPARFERHNTAWPPADASRTMKLYQPVHGRFYLVCASLVCVRTGLPDHAVDTASGQKTAFLLRKLARRDAKIPVNPADPATYREAAWITEPTALYGKGWLTLTDPAVVKPGEGRNPMFPMAFSVPGRLRPRRVHAGLISTSSRETYQAGPESKRILPAAKDAEAGDPKLQRKQQFHARFTRTVLDLLEAAPSIIDSARSREVTFFALLDLGEYLKNFLPRVLRAAKGEISASSLGATEKALFDRLAAQAFERANGEKRSWIEALRETEGLRAAAADPDENLETFPWFDFRSTDPQVGQSALEGIAGKVAAALGPIDECGACQSTEATPELPRFDSEAGDYYLIRCLYERPACHPWEGPVLGDPGAPFQLAPFLDPDAPFRPVRIPMPVDTSIQGLRKFPKTVAFMVSDRLRNQMERFRDLKKMDGDLKAEGAFDFGIICSLSIPIITICALILLLIIVQILNMVFWWIPFLKVCFPIPLRAPR